MAELRRIQRFGVIEQLGTGGMGAVYRARDPQLERDVAIKVVLRPLSRSPQLSENDTVDLRRDGPASPDDLLREARMMAQLSHQNVLPVYEVGLCDGAMFVVMEYVAGTNLRTWLEQEHATGEILNAFAQAARGLAAAHACGIVHRDFKPENVLIGHDGRVRVADFGLSRLTTPAASAMVRFDEGGAGTPRYMAPELWRGETATPKSDVFAFCTALREATDGHALAEDVNKLVDAGIADAPAARPELAAVLDAIATRRPGRARRWLAIGGATVAALGIGGAAMLLRPADEPAKKSCTLAPSYFARRWDGDVRGKLRAALARTGDSNDEVERVVTELDRHAAAIAGELEATCAAERDGQLGQPAAALRRACLDRRTFSMSGAIQAAIASTTPDPGHPNLTWWAPVDQCRDSTQAPVADAHAEEQRYVRLFSIAGVAATDPVDQLGALADDAAKSGDTELAAQCELAIGKTLAYQRDPRGDSWLQRAYRHGIAIHSNDLATAALLARTQLASELHDDKLANELGGLARDAADKPTTGSRLRTEVHFVLGTAAAARGDHRAAIDDLQKGLEIVRADGGHHPQQEIQLRLALAEAFADTPGESTAAIALARESVDLTRKEWGDKSYNLGIAKSELAHALGVAGKHEEALAARREARAIVRAQLPESNWLVVSADFTLAVELINTSRYDEAQILLRELISKHGDALGPDRLSAVGLLGLAQYNTAQFATGIGTLARAVDEAAAHGDGNSANTLDLRKQLVRLLIRHHDTAEADRRLMELEASWRAKPEKSELELATLSGELRASIVLQRDKAAQAERLTRAALDSWAELHGGIEEHADLESLLASELLAQHRWQDAKDVLERVRTDLTATQPERADLFAAIDAKTARAEAGLGHREQAVALAQRALDAIAKLPAEVEVRRDAERVSPRR